MESIVIQDNKHGIYKCMETSNADPPFFFFWVVLKQIFHPPVIQLKNDANWENCWGNEWI